jgi:hypothetical protein
MHRPSLQIEQLLNKCDPPARAIMHMVPTRIIRIVDVKDDGVTFRVEQLVQTGSGGQGTWRTLNSHTSPDGNPGESLEAAVIAARKAQSDLIYKIRKQNEQIAKQLANA